jgi:hypothetical protein
MKSTLHLPGQLAECGVYQGASVIPIGLYLAQKDINKKVLGFDSFEGFDQSIAFDLTLGGAKDDNKVLGGFGDTSCDLVAQKIKRLGLGEKITIVRGYFRDTLPSVADLSFCFVHLDCDTYRSYFDCLNCFYSRTVQGGVILFDEYNDPAWPGCNQAIDEFLADKQERPLEIISDNMIKYFIRKD